MCNYDEECSWRTKSFTCDPNDPDGFDHHPGWEHAKSWERVQAELLKGHLHDRDGDPVLRLKQRPGATIYVYVYDDDGDWAEGDVALDLDDPEALLVPAAPPAPVTEEEMAEVYAALGVSV